jgi:hypothetical protein
MPASSCIALKKPTRVGRRPRRRGSDNLAFLTQIRTAIPARQRIYSIQDNLSANWTPDIRAYAAANKIELVATPTYAGYLNRAECRLFPIAEFVVNNADYVDWDAFAWALARHAQHRNGRTATSASAPSKPATRSAPDDVSGQTFREGPPSISRVERSGDPSDWRAFRRIQKLAG